MFTTVDSETMSHVVETTKLLTRMGLECHVPISEPPRLLQIKTGEYSSLSISTAEKEICLVHDIVSLVFKVNEEYFKEASKPRAPTQETDVTNGKDVIIQSNKLGRFAAKLHLDVSIAPPSETATEYTYKLSSERLGCDKEISLENGNLRMVVELLQAIYSVHCAHLDVL